MVKKKNTIPDGWRNIQPVGNPVPGTRFIGFKVPLKGVINNRLTPAQRFTPKDLIPAMKALNVELGLIIDLTFTTRYYDVKDLPKSIEYKKLFTLGHEVPDDATILQFKKWVRRFLWENADNDKLIGVHCSNGINRTGYLICRYLIDVEGWDPETAIQAFGEARGHQMDGKIYLADLRTQPMRSNLGMNLWDADGDVVPPQNDIFPNEECPRTGKRLRVYEDNHSDLPEQIGLREFDFINKGPGQRRKPYHDQGFQDDLQPLVQMKKRHFPEHPFYDGDQEEIPLKDIEFTTRESERRLRPCHGRELCNDFPAGALPGDTNDGHGKRQSHSPDVLPHSDKLRDMQPRGTPQQQQRPFYDLQSNDEYVRVKLLPNMQLKDLAFHSKRPGQRARQFLDCPPHDNVQLPMGDFEFVNRGCGQRIRPFSDNQHHNDLPGDMPVDDLGESKCQPLCGHQSNDEDFLTRTPGQRLRSFNDHSPLKNNMAYEAYIERDHSFLSRDHFSASPVVQRDYDSDEDGSHRNFRSDCLEDYRSVCSSNEIKREKNRFAPYPSHPIHHLSPSQHEVDLVSVDHERESRREMATDMSQRKRLPVVIIDYNYGLPLDHIPKEEGTVHYDLRQGFSTYSPQAGSGPQHHFMWPTLPPEADADALTTAVDTVYGSVYGRGNHQSSPLGCLRGHDPAHSLKRLRTPDLHSRGHCVWK